MIEFVGFNVSSDPEDAATSGGFAAESASPGLPQDNPQGAALPLRVSLEWPMLTTSPSVTTGGVGWIAPGEFSLTVAVELGYPAITASIIDGDLGLCVEAVSLDGSGTATIHFNRPSTTDAQVVWFVVEPS